MKFNIKEIPRAGLCGRCTEGQILSHGGSVRRIYCTRMKQDISQIPDACSMFDDMRFESRYDFEDIGWVLETRGGSVLGFKPPKKDESR